MKILFIGHDAGRTGAPLLLLNFMTWLSKNAEITYELLLLSGGEIESDYEAVSKVYGRQSKRTKRINRIIRYINRIFNTKIQQSEKFNHELLTKLQEGHFDLIYGSTIVSISAMNELIRYMPNPDAILHIHELNDLTSKYTKELSELSNSSIRFITPSKLTMQNLIENHGISSTKIFLIYEYIDTKKIICHSREMVSNKFIIHGSGYVQIRKGYDIFISIAKRARTKYPTIPFKFSWIGEMNPELDYYIQNDLVQSDLSGIVEFKGSFDNPYQEFTQCSVFLMTSRQDPFPLVCLEHAVFGKPIVCFDKGTGIVEFVENDAGIIVPYMDIEACVDALALLYNNNSLLESLGKTAAEKVKLYDIDNQATKIVSLIQN